MNGECNGDSAVQCVRGCEIVIADVRLLPQVGALVKVVI